MHRPRAIRFDSRTAKQTPWYAKVLALITVAYALSPIDLIPDFIPFFGYLDDLIILPLLVACTVKCIPKDVYVRHCAKAAELWANGEPQKWYYALPIILLWALIIGLVVLVIVL